jgi:hypothetical protein
MTHLTDDLETLEKSNVSNIDRATALDKLAASVQHTDQKRAELLACEAWAFRLMFDRSNTRLGELNLFGIVFPGHVLDYFETRLSDQTSCFVRARLADIIWETRRKHTYAQVAIDANLECVSICMNESRYLELADSLQRATGLSVSLNDTARIGRIEPLANKILQNLDEKNYRWGIEVVNCILAIRRHVRAETLKDAYTFCEKAYNWFKDSDLDNFHIQREYAALSSQLAKEFGLTLEIEKWRREYAEVFVREAEWKEAHYQKGAMVASHFYREAAQAYQDLGLTDKAQEMLKFSRTKMEEGWAKTTPLVVKTEVPHEAAEQAVKKYTEGKTVREILIEVSSADELVPSYETAKQIAEKIPPIASVSLFEGARKVAGTLTSQEIQATNTARFFMVNCSGNCQLLVIPILSAAAVGGCSSSDFSEVLMRSNALSTDRCVFLRTAFDRYLAGDYLSCVHLMLPQIEGWLRDGAAMIGLPTTYIDNKIVRVRTLQTVLESLKQQFSGHVWEYIYAILVDDWAFGLRDRVAHGLLEAKRIDVTSAALLIHVCLLLSNMTWKTV